MVSSHAAPARADLSLLQPMFDDAGWKLFTAHTYTEGMAQLRRELIPVVLCECQLSDCNWRDVLSRLAPIPEPPRLIVVSHHADERLWLEVLNLGGFDCSQRPSVKSRRGMQLGRRGSIGNTPVPSRDRKVLPLNSRILCEPHPSLRDALQFLEMLGNVHHTAQWMGPVNAWARARKAGLARAKVRKQKRVLVRWAKRRMLIFLDRPHRSDECHPI
jgi:hypothetical protein